MANDYPVKGPPSIDLRTFQAVLTAAHSPAAGSAPAIYAAVMAKGVDPAVVLAIAGHESNYGKAGIAVGRNNLFGDRYYPSTAAYGATNRGGWAAFPTYAAGAAYTAGLLASHGGTARSFPTWYAPSSDGNDPARYGAAIVASLNRWTGSPQATVSAAKPAAKATPKPAAKAVKPAAPVALIQSYPTGTAIAVLGLGAILLVLAIKR